MCSTNDRGIEFQQNIAKFRIGIVVVHVPKEIRSRITAPSGGSCGTHS
jgi:hypothetical protein